MASGQPATGSLKRRVRRKTRALPLVIILALLVGGGWYAWVKTHPAEDPNGKMLTDTVKRGDLIETVSSTGSVTAQTGAQVKIGSQITGRIKRLYSDVGSEVKAGEVIAELDLPDIAAQVRQAEANLASARTRLVQQENGFAMQRSQTENAITQAKAQVQGARARVAVAEANSELQVAQTPTSIRRAETALVAVKAALSTAKAVQNQTQAGADLQIATAQEQIRQAQANAENTAITLKRQQELLKRGFVAASLVDSAAAANTIAQSQVSAARQNIGLVQQKVTADVQTARNQVTQAQEDVASAEAALEAARAGTYQNAARAADVNDARAQLEQAKANLTVAEANTAQIILKQRDIEQAREAVRSSQAQVDYARAQFDKTFIRSPITGTVLQLASQQGETLAAGLSAPTLIIVADLNRLQVDVFVDETDIGKLKIGQEAAITMDAFPREIIKGRVAKIASGSTIQQGVITYDVTVAIPHTRNRLKPDMTAGVTIQTGKRENVLLVPSEAVKIGKDGATVNVVKKKDSKEKPEARPVKIGASDGVNTEVTDGLKEGETIVLAGMDDGRRQRPTGSPFGPSGSSRGGGGGGGGRR